MHLHASSRLTPLGRRTMCERVRIHGWTVVDAAAAAGLSERRAYVWLARYDAGHSLTDRSSRPHRSPARTPAVLVAAIKRLRHRGKTSSTIAALLGMAVSTVCAILARLGLNRLSRLGPTEPANRYQRERAGDLVHLDIKTLGRFHRPGKRVLGAGAGRQSRNAGWEAVHVAVDDATRLAYVEVLADQRATTAVGFLARATAWFATRGITVREVMTDNGSAYCSKAWAQWCASNGLIHIRTRPYRPRTNGKAERFIQTLLREWAYAVSYETSELRREALADWIRYYNQQRPHGALGHRPPMQILSA
jgi:transposase InsO family protein